MEKHSRRMAHGNPQNKIVTGLLVPPCKFVYALQLSREPKHSVSYIIEAKHSVSYIIEAKHSVSYVKVCVHLVYIFNITRRFCYMH